MKKASPSPLAGGHRPRGRPRQFDLAEAVVRALSLFRERGYEGTSVADLTRVIGISPTSLYGVFDSKEALFEETVKLYQRTEGAFASAALAAEGSAYAAIERLMLDAAEAYASGDEAGRGGGGCFISLGVLSCDEEHAAVAARMAIRRQDTRAAIAARISQGCDSGEFAPTTDSAALAAFYAATLQGMSVQARDGAGRDVLRDIAQLALMPLRQAQSA